MASSASPRLITQRACEVCQQKDRLQLCSACQVVYYCGKDHQASHRPSHKRACTVVRKARASYVEEELKLRDMPEDFLFPGNVFETSVGHFWGIIETRPYMRARYHVVDSLLLHFGGAGGRAEVVETCLDHLLDMLRLCRGDNMGVRDLVPALYIRLGRDQEAYDFVKWWATTGQQSDYDWGDVDLPYLDVKDADVLEKPVEAWMGRFLALSHVVAVLLVKIRIFLDLQAVQKAVESHEGTSPAEIVDSIRSSLVGSAIASRPEIPSRSTEDISTLIQTIKDQVKQLFKTISGYNPHYWEQMLDNPADAIANRPGCYTHRTPEEARLVLGYNYYSWEETPGAIAIIKKLVDKSEF